MRNKIRSAKYFVRRHKMSIAITTTAVATTAACVYLSSIDFEEKMEKYEEKIKSADIPTPVV